MIDVTYNVETQRDEDWFYAVSGMPAVSRKRAMKQLESGELNLLCVRVTAKWLCIHGEAHMGSVFVTTPSDIDTCVSEYAMCSDALKELTWQIHAVQLNDGAK